MTFSFTCACARFYAMTWVVYKSQGKTACLDLTRVSVNSVLEETGLEDLQTGSGRRQQLTCLNGQKDRVAQNCTTRKAKRAEP